MNNPRKNLLALGLASAILAAAPAWVGAQPAGSGPMMGGQDMMRGYGLGAAAGIELSDEQRAKMREIQREQFKQETGLREKLYDEYGKLEEIYDADKPDPKAVRDAYDRIYALRKQMIEARVQSHNRMYDLLTDEQRKLWKSQRRQVGGMGRGMMGPGMMGPGMMGRGMMGPGMMGPGMMGPGMMGPGMMGPGMMGPGYGPWWLDDE
ncbi:MAG: Spy/CpxP family protein refolding chaperone [Pseudomonadota bacterium]